MKIKILVVEDIKIKRDEIVDYIHNHFKILKQEVELHIATNYQEATIEIDSNDFYKIILDMTMPESSLNQNSNSLNPFAGEDLLFELNCLEHPPEIIILTMYDNFKVDTEHVTLGDLEKRISSNFLKLNIHFAYYQTGSSKWKGKLKDFLEN